MLTQLYVPTKFAVELSEHIGGDGLFAANVTTSGPSYLNSTTAPSSGPSSAHVIVTEVDPTPPVGEILIEFSNM